MSSWSQDILNALGHASSAGQVFHFIERGARHLGFEQCAYGLRVPGSFTAQKTLLLSTYDARWQRRYQDAGYLDIDPTVAHGVRSCMPVVWNDALFRTTPGLWEEARSFGLRVGWAQSCFGAGGTVGMLSVARSQEPLSEAELEARDLGLRWLANVAHLALSSAMLGGQSPSSIEPLTSREIDVLKWTGDGKTADEVADLLAISVHTVHFHLKNITAKLNVANKAAAVGRATLLGLMG